MTIKNLVSKWALIAGWSAAAAIGCATPGSGPFARKSDNAATLAEKYEAQVNSEKKKIDPVKLPLAYARWQEQLGNFTEAKSSYERLLDSNPKSPEAIVGLARIDQLAGRTFEAERGFHRAMKMRPDDPAVMDAFGQFYASQERWNDAIGMLQKATQKAPTEPDYRYHLAVAMARSGDIDASRPHFAKTVGDAESHYNIGYILYERGQLEQAEQEFLQAILKKPQLDEAQAMYDEVRAEREDIQVAGGTAAGSTLGNRPRAAAPQARPAETRTAQSSAARANQPTSAVAASENTAPRRQAEPIPDRAPIPDQTPIPRQRPIQQTGGASAPQRPADVNPFEQTAEVNPFEPRAAVSNPAPMSTHTVGRRPQMPVQPPQWPAAPGTAAAPAQNVDYPHPGGWGQPGTTQVTPAPNAGGNAQNGLTVPQPWNTRPGSASTGSASTGSASTGTASTGTEPWAEGMPSHLSPAQLEQLRNQTGPGF